MYFILPLIILVEIVVGVVRIDSDDIRNRVLGSEIAQNDAQPTDSPTDTPELQTPNPTAEPLVTSEPAPIDTTNPNNTAAVVNSDSTNSTENANPETVDNVQKEEDLIDKTEDPSTQNQILEDISKKEVLGISKTLEASDWNGVDFALQRLNSTLSRIGDNSDKIIGNKSVVAKNKIANLCNISDPLLRGYSLTVPEDLQQDVEMSQAKCLELTQ